MNAPEPQDPGQTPRSHRAQSRPTDPSGGSEAVAASPSSPTLDRGGERPIAPADRPTVTSPPAASGIGLALGSEIAVVSEPEDFIHELTQTGLMAPEEAAEYRRRFADTGDLHDARAVSRELVRSGRLTAYQAAAVLQGKTKGLLIGSYLVLDRLGAGSMGIVLKAEHRRLKRVVALKLLPPSLARNPSSLARFHREAKAAARLSHPNVVSVLDADEFRGLHFLVMEYVEGSDLARLVREQGTMDVPRAIDCLIQAARGLKAAYEADVVHRDIKPSNLLLDPGGTLKILDMGVARLAVTEGPLGAGVTEASLTESNVLVGTVDYMAPEQASNPKLADHRSDIYSLGCTLHYLLNGRPPYTAETFMERLWAHREQPIPSLSAVRSDTPESLDRLFARMMSKTPADRVSSLDELVTGLEACLADHAACRVAASPSVSGPAPTASIGQAPVEPGAPAGVISAIEAIRSAFAGHPRRVWLTGAGITALAGLLGLAVLLTHRPSEKDRPPNAGVASVTESVGNAPTTETFSEPPSPTVSPPAVVTPEANKPQDTPPELIHPEAGAIAAAAAEAAPKTPRKAEAVGLVREFRGHQGRVNGVAVSADGTRALSGGQDRSVRLWDVAGGAPLLRLDHDGPVTCVGMTPDGQLGISGSLDRTVRVWDLRPDRSLGVHRLEGHTGPVFAVALSPDRRLALSGGGDKTIRVWDLQAGRPDGQPLLHESGVVALAVSRGGIVLACCEDATLWQWDLASRQSVRCLLSAWPVLCVALSPDGHHALSGHPDGNLVLWNLDLGTEIGRMSAHGDYIRSVAFSPDGRRVLAGSQEGMLMLWDVEGRRVSHRFRRSPERSAPAGQMDIAPFPDGLHALTAETDGMVRLWGLPSPDGAGAGLPDAPIGQR